MTSNHKKGCSATFCCCCSVAKSCPIFEAHGLQHTRLLCPLLTPGVYPNSRSLNQWSYLTISSSATPFSFSLQSFSASGSFPDGKDIRWPKYWSFNFSNSFFNEYSGLVSFKIDWFDLLAVQVTLKSLLQHNSSKTSILWCSAFFIVHSHVDTWPLEKPQPWLDRPLLAK